MRSYTSGEDINRRFEARRLTRAEARVVAAFATAVVLDVLRTLLFPSERGSE